eukprot:scaffold15072_cov68-Phaeocystis_antarctica.AAC.16
MPPLVSEQALASTTAGRLGWARVRRGPCLQLHCVQPSVVCRQRQIRCDSGRHRPRLAQSRVVDRLQCVPHDGTIRAGERHRDRGRALRRLESDDAHGLRPWSHPKLRTRHSAWHVAVLVHIRTQLELLTAAPCSAARHLLSRRAGAVRPPAPRAVLRAAGRLAAGGASVAVAARDKTRVEGAHPHRGVTREDETRCRQLWAAIAHVRVVRGVPDDDEGDIGRVLGGDVGREVHSQRVGEGRAARLTEAGRGQRHFGVQAQVQLAGRQVHAVRGDRTHGVEASGLTQHESGAGVALRSSLGWGQACAGSASLDANGEADQRGCPVSASVVGRADSEDGAWSDLMSGHVSDCALEVREVAHVTHRWWEGR